MNATARKFIVFVLSTSLLLGLAATTLSHETASASALPVQQPDQAGAALQEGRRLLKRGKGRPGAWSTANRPKPLHRSQE